MPVNSKSCLFLSLLFSALGAQIVGAQSVTVKVTDGSGQPVQGIRVAAYTDNMCTQPKETNNEGRVELNAATVRYLLVFDADNKYAPTAKGINYSSTTYDIGVDKRLTKRDTRELINTLIEATSTAYDIGKFIAEVAGKAASTGPALGVPGVFSMTPAINENGQVVMKVQGALIRQWQRIGTYYLRKNCPYEYEETCVKTTV